jgi:hypothetical protein
MTDGGVVVREHGEAVHVETPSLNGEISVDLDGGGSGQATIHAPTSVAMVYDDELDGDQPEEDSTELTDGGQPTPTVTDRVTLRGSGISQEASLPALIFGVVAILAGAAGEMAGAMAILAGLALSYVGARAYFGLRATGGDHE